MGGASSGNTGVTPVRGAREEVFKGLHISEQSCGSQLSQGCPDGDSPRGREWPGSHIPLGIWQKYGLQYLEAVGQLRSLQKVLLQGHLNRASPWQLHPCKENFVGLLTELCQIPGSEHDLTSTPGGSRLPVCRPLPVLAPSSASMPSYTCILAMESNQGIIQMAHTK